MELWGRSDKINHGLPNTTVDPLYLGQILKKLKGSKIDNVIMEASSHGLKQHRLDGLQFSTGIFTNLSQDHIDYHKNFRNYFKAKLYLFEKLIKPRGSVITDDKIPEFKKINSISKKRGLASIHLIITQKILKSYHIGLAEILRY